MIPRKQVLITVLAKVIWLCHKKGQQLYQKQSNCLIAAREQEQLYVASSCNKITRPPLPEDVVFCQARFPDYKQKTHPIHEKRFECINRPFFYLSGWEYEKQYKIYLIMSLKDNQ